MKRRDFVKALGAGTLLAGGLSACGSENQPANKSSADRKTFEWRMVTTWPPNFPGLGTGANRLAKRIEAMSGGRIRIRVYGGGELVPPLETFDTVSRGAVEMGHGAAYYWKGKAPAAQFFAAVPFGMTGQEMNGWLYHGGGIELWRELYQPFNLVPFPVGNTGVQMGGWFNVPINSVADLNGLKMRIPGLGGEVLKRAGGTPVTLAGSEIFTALQTGAIDATEWVGPYNDLAFGLFKAAKYYYYPGWHEPGSTLECIINRHAWQSLPEDLQAIVAEACRAANLDMLAEFTARNQQALRTLVDKHHVDLRPFPADVLSKLRKLSAQVLEDTAGDDAAFRKVFDSYRAFQKQVTAWDDISERAYMNARAAD
ncbi:MAG: TRAP transporter substrate-binding protein [Gammaproteobacteria bacterium]|jgi:TRAP-type mannitol/chloroaromatic compound transport system substrate-binding protein